MHPNNASYIDISNNRHERREGISWYWRMIAFAASWMILGGYLLLPGLYAKDTDQFKIKQTVLSVFIAALLTAGYSLTGLLCFACRNEKFQAEGVFLPALSSSAFGLISIAYNFLASRSYVWGNAAISGTVVSTTATLLYGSLLLWTHRRIVQLKGHTGSHTNLWSDPSYYNNFLPNMYPTAHAHQQPLEAALTEDDRVNQQMALLLRKSDSRPSPDANSTFRIDLPEDREEQERHARSQELVGTPGQIHADWSRNRTSSRPGSLSEQQAWEQWQERGRPTNRLSNNSGRSSRSRDLSREERRREIELGHV